MEPHVTRFRFGDFFDPEDELSRWLIAVSLAVNDTTLTIKGLVDGYAEGANEQPFHERVYRTRQVGLHLWEAIELTRAGAEIELVKALYDELEALDDPRPHESRERLLALHSDPAQAEVRKAMRRCRDYFGHYPELSGPRRGVKTLAKAMMNLRDKEATITTAGPGYGALRLDYADAVALDLLFHRPGDQDDEAFLARFEGFVAELRDLTTAFWWFSTTVISRAMEARPDLFHLPPRPQTKAQVVAANARAHQRKRRR